MEVIHLCDLTRLTSQQIAQPAGVHPDTDTDYIGLVNRHVHPHYPARQSTLVVYGPGSLCDGRVCCLWSFSRLFIRPSVLSWTTPVISIAGSSGGPKAIHSPFVPACRPDLNIIERLWKWLRKTCLYAGFHEDFPGFSLAIEQTLPEANATRQKQRQALLTLYFQLFDKSVIHPV